MQSTFSGRLFRWKATVYPFKYQDDIQKILPYYGLISVFVILVVSINTEILSHLNYKAEK